MARVLITGAGSGLGAALATQCMAQTAAEVTALDLAPGKPGPHWVVHDMAARDSCIWSGLAQDLRARGPFDLVILNAGINATGPFENVALDAHQAVTAVNLHGPIRLTHMLLAEELLAPHGRLVFVASLSCFTGYPGAASYAASKDGLASFARALRRPLRKSGNICVQLVCPGPMDTPHAAQHAPKEAKADRRLAPGIVAQKVLDASRSKFLIVPGFGATMAAALGRLFPQTMTRIMGRVLFQRLKARP